MISVTSTQLYTWIAAFIWPLARILGLISMAPPFSNAMVPTQVKLMLGIFIAILISPTVPALPAIDPMSLTGLLILVQEMITGLAMGMVMSMAFTAVEMGGMIISSTMGLSFAAFFDPTSQGQTAVISQFYSLLCTLIFLSINGHLVLLATLSESFKTLPISAHPMGTEGVHQLVLWAGSIFSMGLQLSMPILGVLLLTNVALGVLSRAAPQLNLFGIGFPITLSVGFILIAVSLPYMLTPMTRLLNNSIDMVKMISAIPSPYAPSGVLTPATPQPPASP
jgi:flagellar biosynthetic protein FliR